MTVTVTAARHSDCGEPGLVEHHHQQATPPTTITMSSFVAPEWLQEHPEVKARGIVLEEPLKPVSLIPFPVYVVSFMVLC